MCLLFTNLFLFRVSYRAPLPSWPQRFFGGTATAGEPWFFIQNMYSSCFCSPFLYRLHFLFMLLYIAKRSEANFFVSFPLFDSRNELNFRFVAKIPRHTLYQSIEGTTLYQGIHSIRTTFYKPFHIHYKRHIVQYICKTCWKCVDQKRQNKTKPPIYVNFASVTLFLICPNSPHFVLLLFHLHYFVLLWFK
jgi:hypothetical protein